MKIAIIGAGNVGGTLAARWAAHHDIALGVRHPDDPKYAELLEKLGPDARAISIAEAASASEVVVLTTPWEGTQEALESAGDLGGKVLVDVTNPIALGAEGLKQGLLVGHTTSGAEQVAAWAPSARVVKAFNTTGYPNMADPTYNGQATAMLFCGDDADAKAIVSQLGEELGFAMTDAGPLVNARLLEPLAMLWIDLALMQGLGVNFAFQVVKRG